VFGRGQPVVVFTSGPSQPMQHIDPATSRIPEPDATGVFSERPLGLLLAHSLEHGLSGTLELADDPRQYGLIVLDAGRPLRVWTSEPVSYLGNILCEGGILAEADLGSTLADAAATKSLHGQLLLSRGLIDETQLASALAHQRLRKLHYLFTFPPTSRFSFYNAVDLVGPRLNDPGPSDPLPSIWRGIVTQPPPEHVQMMMAALGGRAIRLVGALDTSSFREEERAVVESLRQWPASVATLATRPGVDERAAELLVYFLFLTKLAEVAEPVAMPSSHDTAPVSSRRGFPAGQAEYVRKITLSTRPPNPHEPPPSAPSSVRAPGIPSSPPSSGDLPPSSVPQSWRGTVQPPSSGPVSPRLGAPPASGPRGSVAPPSAPLVFPPARPSIAPGSSIAPPAKSPEAERAVADAEMNFLLGDRRQALEFVKTALEHAPKMPAAMVLLAALEATNVSKGQEEKLQPILKRLDSILLRDPACRRGHAYRGTIRRRAGDLDGAIDDLRLAVEQDPEDVDAARELKITERTAKQPKAATSFLDRLLGK
jgi:hypothetical protein